MVDVAHITDEQAAELMRHARAIQAIIAKTNEHTTASETAGADALVVLTAAHTVLVRSIRDGGTDFAVVQQLVLHGQKIGLNLVSSGIVHVADAGRIA